MFITSGIVDVIVVRLVIQVIHVSTVRGVEQLGEPARGCPVGGQELVDLPFYPFHSGLHGELGGVGFQHEEAREEHDREGDETGKANETGAEFFCP